MSDRKFSVSWATTLGATFLGTASIREKPVKSGQFQGGSRGPVAGWQHASSAKQYLSVLTGANCELIQRTLSRCGSARDVRTGPCRLWKAAKAKMSNTIRVLVVDDFKTVREWVRTKLERTRFVVAGEAADGREACQQARELLPDLILLDLNLPDMNGFEVLKQLCHAGRSATVLFLSAYNDAEIARNALDSGASGYVLKSEAPRELLPAMEAVLCGTKFVSRCLNSRTEALNDSLPTKHQFADVT